MKILYNITLKIADSGIARKLKKVLPSFLFKAIGYIYTTLSFVFAGYYKELSKNRKLKNLGKGKRAFLLATGPSIKKENLKLLEGEDCFSVSNFFLHDDINIINPVFHFFFPYHKPLILENFIDRLRLADKTLPKSTKIFLGHTCKEYVDKYNLFKDREIHYLFLTNFANKESINIEYPILIPPTGPQLIIPVLAYMGYKEIYLIGCDHNTIKNFGGDREDFYDRSKDIRKNAADKNSWISIVEFLESQLQVFRRYSLLKKICNKKGIKIINLSKESWLDEFEKSELDIVMDKKING